MKIEEREILSLTAELAHYQGACVMDSCIDRLMKIGIDFTEDHAKYIIDHLVDE